MTVTVWFVAKLPAVKVKALIAIVPSVVLLLLSGKVTLSVGCEVKRTVNRVVPPVSVVLIPDDLEGMAQAAIRVMTDPGLHQRIVRAARRSVHERFCDEKIVPVYEAYYEEILKSA